MRTSGITRRVLLKMPRETKAGVKKNKLLASLLILIIFMLSLGITQETLGIFSRSFVAIDSAMAAKFNVIITPPEEFWQSQDENNFEYRFLSDIDFQGLVFKVTNNGEHDILCAPYINGDITYRIYVGEEAVTAFPVAAKETVSFWLIIAPTGLDTNMRNVKLFADIQQTEGRQLSWRK